MKSAAWQTACHEMTGEL